MSVRCPPNARLGIEQLERRDLLSISSIAGQFGPSAALAGAVATDDFGNTFAQAALISLSSAGSATQTGRIEQAGDVDMFRFVAPVSGQMTIREVAGAGSMLDPYLYAYNASQQLLAQNDDSGGSTNSQVQISVVAGATYYVKAAAYVQSTGTYSVQFSATPSADDYANTFASATAVVLTSNGSATKSGTIEKTGDVDMFRFVATASGQMTIQETAAAGSTLDSYLYVYNASQQLLAQNDDNGSSPNSLVQISVVAGKTYYVKAGAYPGSTGAYVLNCATTSATASAFQVDMTLSGLTTSQQSIARQAATRWQQAIVGDLPDVVYQGQVIDDVRINVSAIAIDGVGGILGQAGPTALRAASYLPYLGMIQLDTSDVAAMETNGTLLAVLEHEMAHVLGFGVIWSDLGLLSGSGTSNPQFLGPRAVAQYNAIFGMSATSVPVEADGGPGTAESHWDESLFKTELMTGYINSGTNPLSKITIASMADLGYQVNMAAAETYTKPTASLSSSTTASTSGTSRLSGILSKPSSRSKQTDRLAAIDLVYSTQFAGSRV